MIKETKLIRPYETKRFFISTSQGAITVTIENNSGVRKSVEVKVK